MSDGHKLKPQHAPKAPHEDEKFLKSTPARPIRILGEYIHPLVQLKREGIGDTVVMFGSARIESHETAQTRCTRLKNTKTSKMSAAKLAKHRADVRHARSLLEMSRYYEEARQLSHKLTTWSLTLGPRPRRGNHGSGKPRSVRSRWQICWPVDRASTRAIRKSLHQPGAQLQFQILFHAQTVVRADRQGLDRVSGRLRDHGRTLGNAHAAANRKACQAEHYSHLWPQVLGRSAELESHGALGHHQRGRVQDAAVCRYRGRGLRSHPRRTREISHGCRPIFASILSLAFKYEHFNGLALLSLHSSRWRV